MATFLENLQQQPSQETFSCKLCGNLHSKVSENLWQTLWKPSQQSFRKPSANFRKSSATFPETFCRNPRWKLWAATFQQLWVVTFQQLWAATFHQLCSILPVASYVSFWGLCLGQCVKFLKEFFGSHSTPFWSPFSVLQYMISGAIYGDLHCFLPAEPINISLDIDRFIKLQMVMAIILS